MTFQNILNFLLSPPGYVLIIFMFSVGARMFKSAQEQRVKKRMLQQHRDAERDSLRTGAKVPQSSLQSQQSNQSSSQQSSQPSEQEQRRQRIEALRQQRIEQLNKIREQRQAGPSAQQAPRPSPQPTARATPRPPVRPVAQPSARPSVRPIARAPMPQKQALTPVIAAAQQSAQRRRPPQKPTQKQTQPTSKTRSSQPRVAREAIAISEQTPITRTSITKRTKRDAASVRTDLRKNMRNAMIYKEILSQPMGLRAPGSDPLSNG